MCNAWCNEFVRRCAARWDVYADILEVGSLNVNGSPRDVLQPAHHGKYVGVDIVEGPGVDKVVSVYDLHTTFMPCTFDVVISTEMLEHVEDWKDALIQMAHVLKVGGRLVITTRSPGFEYHPYPLDCWRFTLDDMNKIFGYSCMKLEYMEPDTDLRQGKYSGVGIMAVKSCIPTGWAEYLKSIKVSKP
jgi:SAM-dependent methyltransferase